MKDLLWKKFDPGITQIMPGMILKVHQDQMQIRYLVGNVNKNLGVCDDCTNFDEEDIVEYSTDFMEKITKHLGAYNKKEPTKKKA